MVTCILRCYADPRIHRMIFSSIKQLFEVPSNQATNKGHGVHKQYRKSGKTQIWPKSEELKNDPNELFVGAIIFLLT